MSIGTVQIATMSIGTVQIATVLIGRVQIATVSIGTVQIATVSIGTVQIATVSIGTVQIATVSIDTVQIATLSIPHYLPFRNSNFHQYQTEREEGTPMSQQPSIYRSLLVQNKVSACKQTELYSQQFSVQCY